MDAWIRDRYGNAVVGEPEVDRRLYASTSRDHFRPEAPDESVGYEAHHGVGVPIWLEPGRDDRNGRPKPVATFARWQAQPRSHVRRVLADQGLWHAVYHPAPPVSSGVRPFALGVVRSQCRADETAFQAN